MSVKRAAAQAKAAADYAALEKEEEEGKVLRAAKAKAQLELNREVKKVQLCFSCATLLEIAVFALCNPPPQPFVLIPTHASPCPLPSACLPGAEPPPEFQ